MAGTNDFKAFATDANANVTSQEEWETLTALKKGFSSGKASSAQVSKALRQPSTMAAVLGQFIANAELDALDDGDVDGLVAKLATAITTNLGLGEAAKRDVGNGQNQIPDMSAWECGGDTTTGWRRSPDGYIEQWGLTEATTNEVLINFPIPFPTAVISINEHDQAPVAGKMAVWQFYKLTNSNVIAENLGSLDKGNPSFNVPTIAGCRWFATGR
ncbi:gp53-like domain-containing protein [Escherichia coli]|uniref:gp53-like domain-containing protein n=2 Tax=Escherichia coli TaxID=562 RepID=UPI000A77F769|nr:hypothetical protein [Escherichia coli]